MSPRCLEIKASWSHDRCFGSQRSQDGAEAVRGIGRTAIAVGAAGACASSTALSAHRRRLWQGRAHDHTVLFGNYLPTSLHLNK